MDLMDDNGNLSASSDQDAFGNVISGNQLGYHLTTKEYNQLISLYYFFMRWYEPKLGRYITKDPLLRGILEKSQSFNSYHFNYNDPVNYFDPGGL